MIVSTLAGTNPLVGVMLATPYQEGYTVVHDISIAVHAGIILLPVNVITHSLALRVEPLHPLSVKYIFVPVSRSTRGTNSKNHFPAVTLEVIITISHGTKVVHAANVSPRCMMPSNPPKKRIVFTTANMPNILKK